MVAWAWTIVMFVAAGMGLANVFDAALDLGSFQRAVKEGTAVAQGPRWYMGLKEVAVNFLMFGALLVFGFVGVVALIDPQGHIHLAAVAVEYGLLSGGVAVATVPFVYRILKRRSRDALERIERLAALASAAEGGEA